MNPGNSYNEPARDPRRAHLRVETGFSQPVNGTMTGDSPQQPSQACSASTSMSMDSNVGIRIRGTAKQTDSKDNCKAFGDFAINVAAYSTAVLRKEQAARKLRSKRIELEKTKEKSSLFPSLLNQSHRSSKAAGEELSTVEKRLQGHLKDRNELIQTISSGMSSNSQEELESMRSELERVKLEMREEVAKARQDAAEARNENERMKREIRRVESKLTAVETETSRTESQLNSASQRMNGLSESIDEANAGSRSLKDEIETFKSNVQSTYTELNSRVHSFQSKLDSNPDHSATISKINDILNQHKSRFNDLSIELKNLEKNTHAVAPAPAPAPAPAEVNLKNHSALDAITDDIQNLSKQINELWKYLEAKDEEVANDSEQRGKAFESQLKLVRDDLGLLSRQSKDNHDEQTQINAASQSDPSVASLKQEVQQHTKLLTNNYHAIQSLELRYNNLTTEAIVRDMVREMQIMYPYASSTQEAIERLKVELGELSRKYSLDNESLNGRITQVSQDLEIMRNHQTILLSSTAEKQTKSIEAIAVQVQHINTASNNNMSQLETLSAAQATSENERLGMVQTMNLERDRIMKKFSSMSTAKNSKQEQGQEISLKLDDIKTRLEDVETTTAKDVGDIDARVENLENQFLERQYDNSSPRPSMERTSESSGEVPLAVAAARKNSRPGQPVSRPPSRPPLLPPTQPKTMNNMKPQKRKTPSSSSSTPQSAKSNDRGTPKLKKLKERH